MPQLIIIYSSCKVAEILNLKLEKGDDSFLAQ